MISLKDFNRKYFLQRFQSKIFSKVFKGDIFTMQNINIKNHRKIIPINAFYEIIAQLFKLL